MLRSSSEHLVLEDLAILSMKWISMRHLIRISNLFEVEDRSIVDTAGKVESRTDALGADPCLRSRPVAQSRLSAAFLSKI
jgi:hypothetical protein